MSFELGEDYGSLWEEGEKDIPRSRIVSPDRMSKARHLKYFWGITHDPNIEHMIEVVSHRARKASGGMLGPLH